MRSSRGSLTFQRPAASGALLLLVSFILLVTCFACLLILKIEAVCSSKTSGNFYQSTRRHIPAATHHHENHRPDRNISCCHHVENGYKVHTMLSPMGAGNWILSSTYCQSWEFVKFGIHATYTSSWCGPVLALLNKQTKSQVSYPFYFSGLLVTVYSFAAVT
jgi:hypothetical protein